MRSARRLIRLSLAVMRSRWRRIVRRERNIHMLLSVPPRYSIAMTIGYLKGKSATRIHRELLHTKGTLFGRNFWARGYCVSAVGLDEVQIRRYIREQEKLQRDRDQDQGELNLD